MTKHTPVPLAYRFYAAVTTLAAPWIHKSTLRKLRASGIAENRAKERLGQASIARPDGDLIWFHAVSVGEFLSILSLLAHLRATQADTAILVTTTTTTSASLADKRLPKGCLHQFGPLDTPSAVRSFLNHWQPTLAVFVESELWPRQIVQLAKRKIPTALINARLSAKSLKNWRKFPKSAQMIMSRLDLALSQTDATAATLQDLGASPASVHTTGDLKKAAAPLPVDETQLADLQSQIKSRPQWLAASTHPGEEEIIAQAHLQILEQTPDALLILAPRHPDRGDEIEALLKDAGLTVAHRSKGDEITDQTQVYLADTLGELGTFFSLAPIACMAGSFTAVGGHNPYEPAHFNCAIVHGPLYANFKSAYADMQDKGACIEVASHDALAQKVIELFATEKREPLQTAAKTYITSGAKTPEIVAKNLLKLL